MLLIDPGRTALSLRPEAASVPYVLQDFRGQVTRAASFLTRVMDPERLLPVLLREFSHMAAGARRLGASIPALVLLEAARAIAQGAMPVGQKLPDSVEVVYLNTLEEVVRAQQCVRFAREEIAVDFLKQVLLNPKAAAAVTAAARDAGDAGRMPEASQAGDFALWLAGQVMTRKIAFLPFGEGVNQIRIGKLRVVWVRHRVPTQLKPDGAPSPPPAPPAPPPIIQALQSALPALPAEISAQAQTLLDAAQNGIPFCEECARAVEGLLGVRVPPDASPAPPPIVQAARSALPELPAEISTQAQVLLDSARSGVPFCEECAKAAAEELLGVPSATAPPPTAPAPPPIIQAVPSTLPELPAEISTQAQALLDSARSGVPFCEECAKAAAQQEKVSGV